MASEVDQKKRACVGMRNLYSTNSGFINLVSFLATKPGNEAINKINLLLNGKLSSLQSNCIVSFI